MSSQAKRAQKPKTRKKLENRKSDFRDFLTVKQAAEILGLSIPTVRRLCETGDLSSLSKPYGSTVTYRIPSQAIELYLEKLAWQFRQKNEAEVKTQKLMGDCMGDWFEMTRKGGIYGKPYSEKTSNDYRWFVDRFIRQSDLYDGRTVQQFLFSFPSHQETTKEHAYKAMVSLGKYLVYEGVIELSVLDEVKTYRPKRTKEPERSIPTDEQVEKLLNAKCNPFTKLQILLMVCAGLRAHEVAKLEWKDINLSERLITVDGKGGKRRLIGLNHRIIEALEGIAPCNNDPLVFRDVLGHPLPAEGVGKRLKRVCKKLGFHTTPHALRRYFATKNAMAGRSIATLQRVLGHSSLATTEKYIRATCLQAAEDMKGWD